MAHRCPTAEFVGTGVIDNYEIQFEGSPHNAHATIASKEGASVPVGSGRSRSWTSGGWMFTKDIPATTSSRISRCRCRIRL